MLGPVKNEVVKKVKCETTNMHKSNTQRIGLIHRGLIHGVPQLYTERRSPHLATT